MHWSQGGYKWKNPKWKLVCGEEMECVENSTTSEVMMKTRQV
jgi:hypothetical protein